MTSPLDFARLAVDPVRLAVLGRALLEAVDIEELAVAMGVPRRRVLAAVARLRQSGLLDDDSRLDEDALRAVAEQMPEAPPMAEDLAGEAWSGKEREVLSRFFSGERLTRIPAQRDKRLVVLERLAQEFEPGVRYPERMVNFMLQMFHPDYAALRRHLVDEGFLDRSGGEYWRSGGRV